MKKNKEAKPATKHEFAICGGKFREYPGCDYCTFSPCLRVEREKEKKRAGERDRFDALG